jgi:hypothetical protein
MFRLEDEPYTSKSRLDLDSRLDGIGRLDSREEHHQIFGNGFSGENS